MGLKDLKSNLDVVGGFGGAPNQTSTNQSTIPGASVENAVPDPNFNTLGGTANSPFNSQDHLVDLMEDTVVKSGNTGLTYDPQQMQGIQPGPPGGDQDLDGNQGPQFQRPTDIASQVHESSLSLVPGGSQNSPYQDLDGLANNPSFADEGGGGKKIDNVDLHEHLLTNEYQYSHNTPVVTIDAGSKDLNGLSNNPSFADEGGAGKQLGGVDLHEGLLTQNYQYNHGGANFSTVTINAGLKDLDGGLPSNGEYLNNLPS
jgi:hypothetical protein